MNENLVSLVGVGITIIGLVYTIIRNFKSDINAHTDALAKEFREENRKMNMRMDGVYHILLKRTEPHKE